jgi:hypothetical protein
VLGGAMQVLDPLPELLVASHLLRQEARVGEHDRELVVEVVGDTTRQGADRLHLLGLEQALLTVLQTRLSALAAKRAGEEVGHQPQHGDLPVRPGLLGSKAVEAQHAPKLVLRIDRDAEQRTDAAGVQRLAHLAGLVGKLLGPLHRHVLPRQQSLQHPGLLLPLDAELAGPRRDAGRLPVVGGDVLLVPLRGRDQVGAVGAGEPRRRLEPVPDAGVHLVRTGLQQRSGELRHPLLDLQQTLELQAALLPGADVAHHHRQPPRARGGSEGAQRRLEPAPGSVPMPGAESDGGGAVAVGGRPDRLAAQLVEVFGVDQRPGVDRHDLLHRVSAQVRDVVAHEEHASAHRRLADRVPGPVDQGAEALVGSAALQLGVQAAQGVAEHLGDQHQTQDLLRRPAPLLAQAIEAQEAEGAAVVDDGNRQVGADPVAREPLPLGGRLRREARDAGNVHRLATQDLPGEPVVAAHRGS